MYPTLLYLPREVAGIPIWGFGLLLAVWLAGWALGLAWLVWRYGWNAETRGHLPFVIVGALAIALITPRIGDERGFPIRGYGLMLVVALYVSLRLTLRRARQVGIDPDLVYSLLYWLAVPGIIGARLFYVIEYWEDFRGPTWTETLANVAQITEGGLVVYGSAISAGLALFAFAWSYRLPALALADLIAPAAALAMGLGRIGCLMNGCCYGGTTDLPWGVRFPYGSPPYVDQARDGRIEVLGIELQASRGGPAEIARVAPGSPAAAAGLAAGQVVSKVGPRQVRTADQALRLLASAGRPGEPLLVWTSGDPVAKRLALPREPGRSLPVHPTQLYSAIDGVLLAWVLWTFTPWRQRDGAVFALFLTLYPLSRFLQEIIRTDEGSALHTGLTISQNVSLLLLCLAVAVWLFIARRPARVTWRVAGSAA